MKISHLSVLLLFISSSVVQAQSAESEIAIRVSTRVQSAIELQSLQSIRLTAQDLQGDVITVNPGSSPNAGKMVARGLPNSDIRIEYIPTRVLTRLEGTETLTFNYQVAGNNVDDQGSAELIGQNSRDYTFNEEGEFYLWIGGNVNIANAVPGNYQGEFTLEIDNI